MVMEMLLICREYREGERMDFSKANLSQLNYLARFTEFRYAALLELDKRILRSDSDVKRRALGKNQRR